MAYNGDVMKISWEYHIMGICRAQYDTRFIYIYIYVGDQLIMFSMWLVSAKW